MCLPNQKPRAKTPTTETTVNNMPSFPLCSDSNKFIPKPSPTTASCSKYFEAFEDCLMYGLPAVKPKRSPIKSAMAGLIKGKRQTAMPMKNSGLLIVLFINNVFLNMRAQFEKYECANVQKKLCEIKVRAIYNCYLMNMTIRYILFSLVLSVTFNSAFLKT